MANPQPRQVSRSKDRPASVSEDSTAFIKAVQEGIKAADAGHTVPYEDVRKWLLSWGTPDELPPPKRP